MQSKRNRTETLGRRREIRKIQNQAHADEWGENHLESESTFPELSHYFPRWHQLEAVSVQHKWNSGDATRIGNVIDCNQVFDGWFQHFVRQNVEYSNKASNTSSYHRSTTNDNNPRKMTEESWNAGMKSRLQFRISTDWMLDKMELCNFRTSLQFAIGALIRSPAFSKHVQAFLLNSGISDPAHLQFCK